MCFLDEFPLRGGGGGVLEGLWQLKMEDGLEEELLEMG